MKIAKLVSALVDSFIPYDLRTLSQHELVPRARALIGGLLFVAGASLLFLIFTLWRQESDSIFDRMLLPIAVIMLASTWISAWSFRRYATFALSTHLFAVAHTTLQLWIIMATGGMRSSPMTFLIVLQPILTFVMAGRNVAALWAAIVVALGVFLGPIDGAMIVSQVAPATREFLRVCAWIIVTATVYGCFWYVDQINRRLAEKISRERDIAQFAAAHDPLTGLLNRNAFAERLETGVQRAQFGGQPLALIYIDLDGFKPINDNLGHHAGDALLRTLAQRLKQAVRSSDTVARLGGDEFGLILEGASRAALERLLPNVLASIAQSVDFENNALQVSASIGAALLPGDAGDPELLSRCADLAMYKAKSAGRNRFIFFSDIPH